jgi:hypothetical protein
MFRHRSAILTDSDKTKTIIQLTKLVTVSPSLKQLMYWNTKLHKVDKHKIIKSQYSNIKTVQQSAASGTAGCCLYSVCSNCTNICLDRCDQEVSGACDVYRVERGAVLYCTARGSTDCFTLDRMLSVARRCLDEKEKEISESLQVTNPFIG